MSFVERLRERFRRRKIEEFIIAVKDSGNLYVDIGVEEIRGVARCQREVGLRVMAVSAENRLILGEEWYPRSTSLFQMVDTVDNANNRIANRTLHAGDALVRSGMSVTVDGRPFDEFRRARIAAIK